MSLPEPPRRQRREIAVYFGALVVTLGIADPQGMIHLPILFALKDALGLRPTSVAVFDAVALLPVYCGVLFGFLRDRWQPFGLGDRGYLMLAPPLAMAGYLWLALHPVGYAGLLVAVLAIMVAFQFMDTSAHALLASVARRTNMTGRLSAVAELAEVAPKVVAVLIGGWLVMNASPQAAFVLAAVLTAAIGAISLWRPRSIFAVESTVATAPGDREVSISRLLRQRTLWPTLAILYLWNFAPGWATPFLYYASDVIHLSSPVFAACKAATLGCIAVAAVGYGAFCHRVSLRRLVVCSVWINAVAGALFLLIGNGTQAVVVCAVVGLATGLGNVAVFDLLLRACPKGMEGSATMLGYAALAAADVCADLLGAWIYDRHGFVPCVVLDVVATLCILPLMLQLARGGSSLGVSGTGTPADVPAAASA